ncbi:hypothetical protein OKW23_000173 [Bacilli bacterium PM5-9]|nr:hypothetical protein [Bacilli bacterium PM5-9]
MLILEDIKKTICNSSIKNCVVRKDNVDDEKEINLFLKKTVKKSCKKALNNIIENSGLSILNEEENLYFLRLFDLKMLKLYATEEDKKMNEKGFLIFGLISDEYYLIIDCKTNDVYGASISGFDEAMLLGQFDWALNNLILLNCYPYWELILEAKRYDFTF